MASNNYKILYYSKFAMKFLHFFVLIGLLFFTSCSLSVDSGENNKVVLIANPTTEPPQKSTEKTANYDKRASPFAQNHLP